jgi:hypothetical protein
VNARNVSWLSISITFLSVLLLVYILRTGNSVIDVAKVSENARLANIQSLTNTEKIQGLERVAQQIQPILDDTPKYRTQAQLDHDEMLKILRRLDKLEHTKK